MNAPMAAASPGPDRMGEFGRIAGVFWSPQAVFDDLAARPRFWAPLILVSLLALVVTHTFSQQVGWATYLEEKMAQNRRIQELPAETQRQIVEQQTRIVGVVAYAGAVAGSAAALLVIAGVLQFVFRIAGASGVSFRQAFGVLCYAWLPFALYQILSLLVLLANPRGFNIENPLPFNIGWFVARGDAPVWLVGMTSSMDVFSFWVMALIALGFSAAAKRLRWGKAFGVVFGCWLAMVALKTGWTAMFG